MPCCLHDLEIYTETGVMPGKMQNAVFRSSLILGIFSHARGSRKFCQRGFNYDKVFFFVDEGREYPNATIEMAFRWRADDGPTLNPGLVAL